MGKKAVLLGFWLVGYALGYFAWMVRGPVLQFVENFGLSSDAAGGLIMGFMGSAVMIVGVLFWSFMSSG